MEHLQTHKCCNTVFLFIFWVTFDCGCGIKLQFCNSVQHILACEAEMMHIIKVSVMVTWYCKPFVHVAVCPMLCLKDACRLCYQRLAVHHQVGN